MIKKTSILTFATFVFMTLLVADENDKTFELWLAVTKQDAKMDWSNQVPSRLPVLFSVAETVVKNEKFQIFPTFLNPGIHNGSAQVSWSIKATNPEGITTVEKAHLKGLEGAINPDHVHNSIDKITLCFEEENAYGKYRIEVSGTDHVKNQTQVKSIEIELAPFSYEPKDKDFNQWFLNYPINPEPSKALWFFTNMPAPSYNKDGSPKWSGIWFFKHVFENNPYLWDHAISFYHKQATDDQKRDLLLVMFLSGQTDLIQKNKKVEKCLKEFESLSIPDPYEAIRSGHQLDMLWAEYFATSHIKPIKHFLSALKLGVHAGTLEKIKSGELNNKDKKVRIAAQENAIFNSAMWSLKSNCLQSRLLFHYCIGLYETEPLDDIQKRYLAAILNITSKELRDKSKEKESN